jgi:hypothetical protein
MARWLVKDDNEVPAKLLDFDPDDWVLGASNSASRLSMALDRWYQARWDWVIEDRWNRTIDGQDVVDLVFEDTR